jgi:hypothetical protein
MARSLKSGSSEVHIKMGQSSVLEHVCPTPHNLKAEIQADNIPLSIETTNYLAESKPRSGQSANNYRRLNYVGTKARLKLIDNCTIGFGLLLRV